METMGSTMESLLLLAYSEASAYYLLRLSRRMA